MEDAPLMRSFGAEVLLQYALKLMLPDFVSAALRSHPSVDRNTTCCIEAAESKNCPAEVSRSWRATTPCSWRRRWAATLPSGRCDANASLQTRDRNNSQQGVLLLRTLHQWLPGTLAGAGMFALRAARVQVPYVPQARPGEREEKRKSSEPMAQWLWRTCWSPSSSSLRLRGLLPFVCSLRPVYEALLFLLWMLLGS